MSLTEDNVMLEDKELENVQQPEQVVDININSEKRTRVRINGRNDSILELNLSDMNIASRLEKGYIQLQALIKKI